MGDQRGVPQRVVQHQGLAAQGQGGLHIVAARRQPVGQQAAGQRWRGGARAFQCRGLE